MNLPRWRRSVFRAGAVVLIVAAGLGVESAPRPAAAVDHSKGQPGFCRTATGVTVVIDFQQLGGETYVRCYPSANRGTGLDALKGAGFQIEGVRRWGEAFICRIENRPSAVEEIAIEGDSRYTEHCLDTPPAAGYWSYWHAGNNCPWNYSQWGVKNRDFVPGGFEGWSFSLNATADTNPVPRIAPVRPGTAGAACTTAAEPPPTTDDLSERRPGVGGGASTPNTPSGGATGGGTVVAVPDDPDDSFGDPTADSGDFSGTVDIGPDGERQLPLPKPRDPASAPEVTTPNGGPVEGVAPEAADNVAFSGGEDARDVRDVIRDQQGGVWWAPWLAAVVVGVLLVGMGWTARARRLVRDR